MSAQASRPLANETVPPNRLGSGTTIEPSVPYSSMLPWRCCHTSKLVAIETTAPLTNCISPDTCVATPTSSTVPRLGALLTVRRSKPEVAKPVTRATGPSRLTRFVR